MSFYSVKIALKWRLVAFKTAFKGRETFAQRGKSSTRGHALEGRSLSNAGSLVEERPRAWRAETVSMCRRAWAGRGWAAIMGGVLGLSFRWCVSFLGTPFWANY